MATHIEDLIVNNNDNGDLSNDDEVVSSTSLFDVNIIASLNLNDGKKNTQNNEILWDNYSKNLIIADGNNVTSLILNENVTELFNEKIPGDYFLKAVSNLPSTHIIVYVSSNNKIIFYDGVSGRFGELSLEIPHFTEPAIYCHRWKDHTYIIVCGKETEKSVWITLTGHVSIYEKSNNLSEALDKYSTSGIVDFSLHESIISFNPESNLLYAFTKKSDNFNRYYKLTPEGIFIHREIYSEKGYFSVTMTSKFGFALSTDGYMNIFELNMLVLCKEMSLINDNINEHVEIHNMQVTATSKTRSLDDLYMLLSISIDGEHQLQMRLIQTNKIVYSINCDKDSAFLRLDSNLNMIKFIEISDKRVTLKGITKITPEFKIRKLISTKKFNKALELGKKYSVPFDPIYKAQASDLIKKLKDCDNDDPDITTLYGILKKIKNHDTLCSLCIEGILSLNMFNVVKKLLDIALFTKTKNRNIMKQLDFISDIFTTSRVIFSHEEFSEVWLSVVSKHTTMHSLLSKAIQSGNYKRAEIIWNRNISKEEFNKIITKESVCRVIKIFSHHGLERNLRKDLMRFMEKNFMPYVLMAFGCEIGCIYGNALIQLISKLEDQEGDCYPSIGYDISLSMDRILKLLRNKIMTPGEKCIFINLRTGMGYDSFCNNDILGKLNMLKGNLLKLINLKRRFNISFKYNKFINMSEKDICLHIIETILIEEDKFESIYTDVFKPYCEEVALDTKIIVSNFIQKWSTQQITLTDDIKVGTLKNKVNCICKLIDNINDPILKIKSLNNLINVVPYNWPEELVQSVHSILINNNIANDIKNSLSTRSKLSEMCHIIKIYKDIPSNIKEVIKRKNQFEYLIQSISINNPSVNIEVLVNDMIKLCQLRHSYCNLPGTFSVTHTYIYEHLWIPYLLQWRFSGFEKEEPMRWLNNLPNIEGQEYVARYSVDYLIDIYKRGRQNLEVPGEGTRYLKTLSIIKSFIFNYLSQLSKYQLIVSKISSIESLYKRFKILRYPTFLIDASKESSNFMEEIISKYGLDEWEKILEIGKISKLDNIIIYKYLLIECLSKKQMNKVSAILFKISLDRDSLTKEMISIIKIILDNCFSRIWNILNESSFNLSNYVNTLMLALKVFMVEGDVSDTSNFDDLLAFHKYHKFLNVIKDMIDSEDLHPLSGSTIEPMEISEVTPNEIIDWDVHPLAHLQKTNKSKYYITLHKKTKPFTRSCLQLPSNRENNLRTLISLSRSIVEKYDNDPMIKVGYRSEWKKFFNQLSIDGQYFDILNLYGIYKTLKLSQIDIIDINNIIIHSITQMLEKILLIPDCDLDLATGFFNSLPKECNSEILLELNNRFKVNAKSRVYLNLCELIVMVHHRTSGDKVFDNLIQKYDRYFWKRKFSKYGSNYFQNITFKGFVSSLVRCNVPHEIMGDFCIYSNIDLNTLTLDCVIEGCLYSSELLESNDNVNHMKQIEKSSYLLSTISIKKKNFSNILLTILKMSPYNHEGILLLINKVLQFFEDPTISDPLKSLLYNWKLVVNFVMSYGERNSEVLPIEYNWLSKLKSNPSDDFLSSIFLPNNVYQPKNDVSVMDCENMVESDEKVKKLMPQCALQRLPFHLFCCIDENNVKKFLHPIISHELNINNSIKWIDLIKKTKSTLNLSQSQYIFIAITKHIKYVEENDMFVSDVKKTWISSIIKTAEISKVTNILNNLSKFVIDIENITIKIGYLNIFKEIASRSVGLLKNDKKEELLKLEDEISQFIKKFSVEKILFDNKLLNQETKDYLYSNKINEMIHFIYHNHIDWNNYQDRTLKIKICDMITKNFDINLNLIHTTIIDEILMVQGTPQQIGDPDATLNTSTDFILPNDDEKKNRLECDILDDDINVSKIVNILNTGNYSGMIKKMFEIINKNPESLPGGITTIIKVIICLCRLYPREGNNFDHFKVKKSHVIIALRSAYYYYMLSKINVKCRMVDLVEKNKVINILKQLQNLQDHSIERDFVIVNIVKDYLKNSSDYYLYMKRNIPRMIIERQFNTVYCILDDNNVSINSNHMGNNILQFVLKTIEGIMKQNPGDMEVMDDMLRFMMKYSISCGYSRLPREISLFGGCKKMNKVANCIINPTGN